jgi:tetratricopeptide (TPR) repeat protein
MDELSRPAEVDRAPTTGRTTTKRRVPVKMAMEEALERYNAGRLDAAAHLCAQIVAGRPRKAAAHNLMGVIFNAMGKHKEAVKSLQRAANLEPRNAQYLANLGEIERQRGKLPEALAALTQAVSVNPKSPQAHNNLGILCFERRDYQRAVDCYQTAIKFAKRFPEAHNNLGNALRALGRQDEALEHYQKALFLRDNYPEAYNNMASVLIDQEKVAEAEDCYRKALQLRPNYLEAYCNLAGLLAANHRESEALRVLAGAIKINKRYVPALVQAARIQLRLGNYPRAEQVCRLAIKFDGASPEAFRVLGQILQAAERYEEAITSYEKVLELRPALRDQLKRQIARCVTSLRRVEDVQHKLRKERGGADGAAPMVKAVAN